MNSAEINRRGEERHGIEAKAVVRKLNGESFAAAAINVSSAGMLLHVDDRSTLKVDDEVSVDIQLPEAMDGPFSAWGFGRVVRIDGGYFGVALSAGKFHT